MTSEYFGISFNKRYKTWQVVLRVGEKLVTKKGYITEIDAEKDADRLLIEKGREPKNFFKKQTLDSKTNN